MHWGLTTFEKKRIEMIALDHPYFDTHAPLLTKKEIAAIVKEGSRKSGYQVIAEVMAELGITYVPAKHKKRSFREAIQDVSFVPSFRRLVILGTLCVLLVLFMTLTAPGRAFAEEMYSIIIDFIDGTLGMRNSLPSTDSDYLNFSLIPDDVESPQALGSVLNYPIVASDNTRISFKYEQIGADVLVIRSTYLSSDGKKCTLVQEIHGKDGLWSSNNEAKKGYQNIDSVCGLELYAGMASDESTFVVGYSESFFIQISGSMSIVGVSTQRQ